MTEILSARPASVALAERLRAILALEPAQPALEAGRWFAWEELLMLVRSLDAQFDAAGIGAGTPVGLVLRNRPAQVAALLQILTRRCCVVPINPFQPEEKIAAELRGLRLPVLIAEPEDWARPQFAQAAHAAGGLGLKLEQATLQVQVAAGLQALGAGSFHERLDDVAVLMLTSGTTGPAKRIRLQSEALARSLLDAFHYESGQARDEIRLRSGVVVLAAPLVHIGGLWALLSTLTAGRKVVLLEKFAVAPWAEAVQRHQPRMASLPPTALRMIFDAQVPKEALASLSVIRVGAAPLDPDFQQHFEERYGVPLLNAYGATEFAGAVAGWTLGDHQRFSHTKRGSVGRAQPGCKIRIVDRDSGAELGDHQVGLVEVKGAQLGVEGWVRTADLGEVDGDGFVFIRGRADDAIIRGGFKILPGDVVKTLLEHPAVAEAAVVGLPDERLGAIPVAAVQLKPGVPAPSGEELLAFARARLTSYMVPVHIKMVETLPRTPSLKISQPGVRALFSD